MAHSVGFIRDNTAPDALEASVAAMGRVGVCMSPSFSPDGGRIAFVSNLSGLPQVWTVDADGGRENNWLGRWSHDGDTLLLSSNRRDPAAMDAYLADIATGELRLVAENRGIGRLSDVSRDGRRAVLYRMLSRSDDNLFLLDLARNTEVVLTPHQGPGSFGGGTFDPDGKGGVAGASASRHELASASRRGVCGGRLCP